MEARILVVLHREHLPFPVHRATMQYSLDEPLAGARPGSHRAQCGHGCSGRISHGIRRAASSARVTRRRLFGRVRARELSPALIAESDLVLTATRGAPGQGGL